MKRILVIFAALNNSDCVAHKVEDYEEQPLIRESVIDDVI